MKDSTPYNMPKEPGRWRAIFLATLVHAVLFGLLWFGIRWQSETPIAVEAEVWSPQVREAASRPQPEVKPEPKPEPEVKPEPKPPEPEPEPPKQIVQEAPKPPVVEQPVKQPDIALEQEKKRLEEKKRLDEEQRKERERQEQERQRKIAEQKAAEEKRIEKEKQEQLAAAKKKAEAEELRKKQAAEKLAAEKLAAEKLAAEKLAAEKAAAEKLRKERIAAEEKAAEEKAAEKRHQETLERMAAQAAGSPGSGNAPRSQGGRADSDYAGRVASKIKSNTVFNVPDALSGNPPVEYEVQLLPDGSLRAVRKVKSSGVPGFDEAVARAIERSSPFPPDRSGTVPSSFNVIHRPKDQ